MSTNRDCVRPSFAVSAGLWSVVACSGSNGGGSGTPPDASSEMDATSDGPSDGSPPDSNASETSTDAGPDSNASETSTDAGPEGSISGDGSGTDGGLASACVASGGSLTAKACCDSSGDFPSTCLVGACGCAPANSHTVQLCDCGSGMCWNGTVCTPRDD